MSGLALIVSHDHAELERLSQISTSAGFSSNCVDNPKVAQDLVSAYGQDYRAVIVDIASMSRAHEDFVHRLREVNPAARVIMSSTRPPSALLFDDTVVVCHIDEVGQHLRGG